MSYTNGLDKPEDYFNTVLYTGDGTSDRTITNTFATDFLWLKERNGTDWHHLWDKVRGDGKRIHTNNTNAESDLGTYIALVSTGFKVDGGTYNNSSVPFVAWQWKANGSGSSNTDGSITSTVSANTTSGFSIVSFTGTGSTATVGHGLGVTPKMFIVKNRSITETWRPYHVALGGGQALALNDANATDTDSSYWSNTNPTSSVFTVGTNTGTNGSGNSMIAYCFAPKKGFSAMGSYVGNGSSDGSFIYTGFKPAFVITKSTDIAQHWQLYDNKRNEYNQSSKILFPSLSAAEQNDPNAAVIDMLSNGFKQRVNDIGGNGSGNSYIYMAFAKNPFVTSTGIPTTGR